MSPRVFSFAVLFLCLLVAGCASHSQQNAALANIRHVAVVPPETRMLLARVGSVDSLRDEERALQLQLSELIAAEICQRGLVLKNPNWNERDASDPAQQSPFFSWDRVAAKVRLSLGAKDRDQPELRMLARRAQADALLLTRAVGFRSSPGKEALVEVQNVLYAISTGVAWPLSDPQGAVLEVALVEAATGQLLWTQALSAKDFKEKRLQKMVTQLFKKFPKPPAAPKSS